MSNAYVYVPQYDRKRLANLTRLVVAGIAMSYITDPSGLEHRFRIGLILSPPNHARYMTQNKIGVNDEKICGRSIERMDCL